MTTRAEQRKKAYRLKRKKRIFAAIRFLIIVSAIYAFIFLTPFFNVKNIYVEGSVATPSEKVVTASGITEGTHILKINKSAAKQGIEKLAYVKTAEIKRVFPNKIKIVVTEGKVLANIALAKDFAAIDETGKIMEICPEPKVYPVIYGLTVKKSNIGEKITIDETGSFDVILEYIHYLSRQALPEPYVSITIDKNDVSLVLESGIEVFFGDETDIEYKVAAFAESLRNSGDVKEGSFDVSNPERIIYSQEPLTPEISEEFEVSEDNPGDQT